MAWASPDRTSVAGALRLVAAVANGAATMLLGRLSGSAPMGVVALSTSAAVLSMTVCTGGIPAAVIRFGPQLDTVGRSLRQSTYRGAVLAALIAGIAVAVLADEAVAAQALLAAVLAGSMALAVAATNRLVLRESLIRVAAVSLVAVVAGFAVGMAVIVSDARRGVLGLSLSTLVTAVVTLVGSAARNPWGLHRPGRAAHVSGHADGEDRPPPVPAGPSQVRSFIRTAWLANALQAGVYRLDALVLGAIAGSSALGRYAIMLKGAEALSMIVQMRSSYVLGHTVHLGEEAAYDVTRRQGAIAWRTALATGIAGWIGYTVAVPVLLGDAFEADRAWFGVLAIPALLLTASSVYTSYFAGRGRLGVGVAASGAGLVIAIPLYALLIPAYGVPGACAASAMVYLGQTAYVGWVFRRTRLAGVCPSRTVRTVPSPR